MKDKWISKALPKVSKGKLHKELGVPEDKKIPEKKLDKAGKTGSPKIKKQVKLAKTLESFHRG